jgi:acetyl esterase/lipase
MTTILEPTIPIAQAFEVEIEDVEYQRQADEPLLARMYRPKATVAQVAILDVHGGAWSQMDRTAQAGLNQAMAAQGALVVAIDFRMPPRYPYPAQIADANFATRWLKLHAEELGAAAAAPVGLFGGSSGGHVVILSAMRPLDPRFSALTLAGGEALDASVDFVVVDAPVTDPEAVYRHAEEVGRTQFLERYRSFWTTDADVADGSPTRILERGEGVVLPRLFISQGSADDSVPIESTRNFVRLYQAAGGQAELLEFEGLGHGFILFEPERAESLRQAEAVNAFIRSQTPTG